MNVDPVIENLGWALLHFIWQGFLIAALTANLMWLIRRRAAAVRYLVACAAMLWMLACPIVTTAVIVMSNQGKHTLFSTTTGAAVAPTEAQPQVPSSFLWSEGLTGWISQEMSWIVSMWLAGVLLLSLRIVFGYVSAQRLMVRGTRPVEWRWQETLQILCARLGVMRPVRLLESAMVQVPTAIGWLRPVILLPACALIGLSPQQLEAVIAHELAHIRRHDYLVNILQRMIETLLFYHPAVWWLSRKVRIEREYCCDDLAVAACGNALLYARALAEMEEMRAEPQLAIAANGGQLFDRIRRLVGIPEPRSNGLTGSLAGLIALLTIVALVASSRSLASASFSSSSGWQHVEALLAALKDEDIQVRDDAITELGKLGDRRAVEPLIALLEDPNVYIRDNAINSLGLIGDRRAVGPLLGSLRDRNVYIRDNAITALGRLRDPRAVEPLITLLGDRNVYLRDNAASALGEIGDRRAVEPLRAALNDENWYVRKTAARSLEKLSSN